MPLEEVNKLLGHESIKTTERSYAKWIKGQQDRLNKLVTATWLRVAIFSLPLGWLRLVKGGLSVHSASCLCQRVS
jgi:hypothetical protein